MSKLKPLGNRVLLVREEAEEQRNGIFIPADVDNVGCYATVVAKGPDCTDAVKIGDKVIVSEYVGQDLEDDNTAFVVVREPELIGVVT